MSGHERSRIALAVGVFSAVTVFGFAVGNAEWILPIAIVYLAVGAMIGRWWSPLLALMLIPLHLPFADSDPDGVSSIVFVVILFVPIAAALVGLGLLGRKLTDSHLRSPARPRR
jgi:hypothetical protein